MLVPLLPVGAVAGSDQDTCAALSGQSFVVEQDAAVVIGSANSVDATSLLPAHCAVTGYIAPQVGFEVRLPVTNWNGRFLQQGCRGMCGFIPIETTNDALARGYAVATTDMGHKAASSQSGIWALNSPQAKIDFGHRATHVTALAAQELIRRVYKAKPRASYFRGCGTGGRQGLVEAQRYPEDFDGIIANGGVIFDFTRLNYLMAWSVRANVDASGRQLLSEAETALVHSAVLRACDMNDGLKDGVIAYPQECQFEPADLACDARRSTECLAPAQVDAVRKMYAGPSQSNGGRVYPGMAKGSELRWAPAFFGSDPRYARFSVEIMRYFLYPTQKGPGFQLRDFDLEAPLTLFEQSEKLVGADTTDYSAFRRRGGRLLMIHGWNESAMPGSYPVQYYDRLARDAGGLAAAREFFRLYMIPGDMHCTSGIPEGRHFDSLSLMERWVEEGVPMDVIQGYEVVEEPRLPRQVRFPLDATGIRTARPFVPYPDTMRDRGRGDPASPASYARRTAPP